MTKNELRQMIREEIKRISRGNRRLKEVKSFNSKGAYDILMSAATAQSIDWLSDYYDSSVNKRLAEKSVDKFKTKYMKLFNELFKIWPTIRNQDCKEIIWCTGDAHWFNFDNIDEEKGKDPEVIKIAKEIGNVMEQSQDYFDTNQ